MGRELRLLDWLCLHGLAQEQPTLAARLNVGGFELLTIAPQGLVSVRRAVEFTGFDEAVKLGIESSYRARNCETLYEQGAAIWSGTQKLAEQSNQRSLSVGELKGSCGEAASNKTREEAPVNEHEPPSLSASASFAELKDTHLTPAAHSHCRWPTDIHSLPLPTARRAARYGKYSPQSFIVNC